MAIIEFHDVSAREVVLLRRAAAEQGTMTVNRANRRRRAQVQKELKRRARAAASARA